MRVVEGPIGVLSLQSFTVTNVTMLCGNLPRIGNHSNCLENMTNSSGTDTSVLLPIV